jgi:hypothetical protein
MIKEGIALTDVNYLSWQALNPSVDDAPPIRGRVSIGGTHFLSALKSFLLVPIFPLAGYWLLDQTGISHAVVKAGLMPSAILGEGFGHVGLCFSLHYILDGMKALIKGAQCVFRS